MKVLFIITNARLGYWLSELTHPYFLLSERGIDIDIASLKGGATTKAAESDPYFAKSWEPNDLMSKGFLSDKTLVAKVENTLTLSSLDLDAYDAVHVVGGIGAAVDLFPSEQVGRVLEHFFAKGQLVGAICHGVIALGNTPNRINGRQVTGFSLAEDLEAEKLYGKDFIPNYPQPVLEKVGATFSHVEPWGVRVQVDGRMITGQNQQSASEYTLAFHHLLTGHNPVHIAK
ncbi:type 1 glutamine amidotransferase domain-containing protein [Granulicella sibirica]|uniref:ThiJ/PfpI family protein n=1 Tax=Granulicella sibirica TaxID=2479048 RepID=A0A4Q0T1H6_9BACT|nr:type 1 glutamine amidotransferase domain-containing protein [Granulicella sibirica]RXH55391.1 ThiJ/PfpI family protein [Granulicella sibirica]